MSPGVVLDRPICGCALSSECRNTASASAWNLKPMIRARFRVTLIQTGLSGGSGLRIKSQLLLALARVTVAVGITGDIVWMHVIGLASY